MVKKIFQPTEEQQKILDIKEGLHLVLAPPGSGKTELLAHRVYNAKKVGIKDSDIICLTFTSRAARGMKDKIFEKYPENEIIIGNIHRYCSLFLFRNNLIPLNTSILDEEDSEQIIEEFIDKWDWQRLSANPNLPLSVKFIQKHIDKIDFIELVPLDSAVGFYKKQGFVFYPPSKYMFFVKQSPPSKKYIQYLDKRSIQGRKDEKDDLLEQLEEIKSQLNEEELKILEDMLEDDEVALYTILDIYENSDIEEIINYLYSS